MDSYVVDENFGPRLKDCLKRSGMTQQQFAEKIGTSKAAVCEYTKNKRSPRTVTAVKMANILGVSVDFLLYGKTTLETEVDAAIETIRQKVRYMTAEQKRELVCLIMGDG